MRNFNKLMEEKIKTVSLDNKREDFGLSAENRAKLCSELNIIINCKQSGVVEDKIPLSLRTNVHGTLMLHKLATECPKFMCFVHLSTAYVNTDKPGGMVEEKVYNDKGENWAVKYEKIMKMESRDVRANTK